MFSFSFWFHIEHSNLFLFKSKCVVCSRQWSFVILNGTNGKEEREIENRQSQHKFECLFRFRWWCYCCGGSCCCCCCRWWCCTKSVSNECESSMWNVESHCLCYVSEVWHLQLNAVVQPYYGGLRSPFRFYRNTIYTHNSFKFFAFACDCWLGRRLWLEPHVTHLCV